MRAQEESLTRGLCKFEVLATLRHHYLRFFFFTLRILQNWVWEQSGTLLKRQGLPWLRIQFKGHKGPVKGVITSGPMGARTPLFIHSFTTSGTTRLETKCHVTMPRIFYLRLAYDRIQWRPRNPAQDVRMCVRNAGIQAPDRTAFTFSPATSVWNEVWLLQQLFLKRRALSVKAEG